MSHNQTMSDKKQMPQATSSSAMADYFRSKCHHQPQKIHSLAVLLAKHQQPHKFPASGSAGASAQYRSLLFLRYCATISDTMKPLLQNRVKAAKPTQGIKDTGSVTLNGDWWLVMPENARDVMFLQLLGTYERYANYTGEGILISDNAIPKYSQN